MEEKLSEVLDNILGLLLLEGSYDVEEKEDAFQVEIETKDAGRLIGSRGESLEGLQLICNQIMSRKKEEGDFKRVILDVGGWRKQKIEELITRAKDCGKQVLDTKKEIEIVSVKLDSIRTTLESINQRLSNLERASYDKDWKNKGW